MAETINPSLTQILDLAIAKKASDVLITEDSPPMIRIDGNMLAVQNIASLTGEIVSQWVTSVMSESQISLFSAQKEIDFSFSYGNFRFRANAFYQRGLPAIALRLITTEIRNYAELGLPPVLSRFTGAKQGFVIITGPTGHGKSTTMAAMIQEINQTTSGHIVTVEDPIEYLFKHNKSVVSQREIGSDTHSFARALRSAVREDPNVILVGEMRDFETADAALTLAETGHLVLTTLHANSASSCPDRIIDMFPPYLQDSVRKMLASVLLGVVSQRLIPKIGGGRTIATEIMLATSAVRSMIRENKTHQLDNIIATSASDGMIPLDKVIAEKITQGEITLDDGLMWANSAKAVKTMLY